MWIAHKQKAPRDAGRKALVLRGFVGCGGLTPPRSDFCRRIVGNRQSRPIAAVGCNSPMLRLQPAFRPFAASAKLGPDRINGSRTNRSSATVQYSTYRTLPASLAFQPFSVPPSEGTNRCQLVDHFNGSSSSLPPRVPRHCVSPWPCSRVTTSMVTGSVSICPLR